MVFRLPSFRHATLALQVRCTRCCLQQAHHPSCPGSSMLSRSTVPACYQQSACTPHVKASCHWVLFDCPCLEHIGEAARSTAAVGTAATGTAAVGAQTTRWFGLHSAEQLINTVHRVEASFHLSRADRAFRLAVTVADQAIQGEGSVRFTQKECTTESLPVKPLPEGVCKFHITDGVGSNVDKLYVETFVLSGCCDW